MTRRLAINPIACTGHGLCADLLPELIRLDEWGYPMMPEHPVPDHLAALARRACGTAGPPMARSPLAAPMATNG